MDLVLAKPSLREKTEGIIGEEFSSEGGSASGGEYGAVAFFDLQNGLKLVLCVMLGDSANTKLIAINQ